MRQKQTQKKLSSDPKSYFIKKCLKGIEEKTKMQKAPALRTTKKKKQIGMMLGLEEARAKNIFIYKNIDTFSLSC